MDPEFRLHELPDQNKETFLGLLGSKDKQINIRAIHMDPKGFHCILVCDQANNFYLNYKESKIRPLIKLKGVNIKTLAFHSSGSETKSGDILFSSDNNIVSLVRLELVQGELV